MYDIPAKPSSTTPVAEAFEQFNDALRDCWSRIAGVVQNDVDRAASGHLGLDDIASFGPRLARAGLANLYELASTLSDNLSILRSTPLTANQAAVVRRTVPVDVPGNLAVTIVASSLTHRDGTVASIRRLTFDPAACDKRPKKRREPIEVTLRSGGLPVGIYRCVLCVCDAADGSTLHEVRFALPVADLD